MPGKESEIKVVSCVQAGGQQVKLEALSPEQRQELATWLRCTYLNALYEGRAVFRPADGAVSVSKERKM